MENKILRIITVLVLTVAAFVGIGYSYERCIGPSQPVWNEMARTWPLVPLSVHFDKAEWGAHAPSMEAAVEAWNKELGCEVLALTNRPEAAVRILSASGEPCGGDAIHDPGHDGQAYLCGDGRAEVHIYHPGTIDCSARIAMHELGHVLGLADTTVGIMRRELSCEALMRVSDAQKGALQGRYCK